MSSTAWRQAAGTSSPVTQSWADVMPSDGHELYAKVVAQGVLEERSTVLDQLRGAGVLTVDVQADQVTAVEFDAVVVPGGYAPDMMRRHPAMVKLVREAAQQGKIVGAICHAGWMLVSAGIVDGRRATSFFSIKDDLIAAGAKWEDSEVVVDGNLITSRKPDDQPAFCRAIVGALSKS